MPTCYRHSGRETGVACSSCGKPICPDCMTTTSVGMRCPDCASQTTKVRRMPAAGGGMRVTEVLIAINVVVFLGELISGGTGGLFGSVGGDVVRKGALDGPDVHLNHEYWRLVTSGFLHAGFLHIALNMYVLYILGRILEPAIGGVRFAAVYFSALLFGSFGALVAQPLALTLGASGAVFGVAAATMVLMRARGRGFMESGLGLFIIINLAFGFFTAGISVGGHIGGLVGGALGGLVVVYSERRGGVLIAVLGCVAVGALGVLGAFVAAGGSGLS